MGFPLGLPGLKKRRNDFARLEFQPVGQALEAETSALDVDAETGECEDAGGLEARLRFEAEKELARIEDARKEARLEARVEWETELAERVAAEREAVLEVCERFGRERTRYFSGVETEVVKLALAVAARVLHREAQLDPLLLTAAVRVALEKVAADSGVTLRVPEKELEMWRGVFGGGAEHDGVRLQGDERLSAGECVLDTMVGRVELGVGAQLAEIERGFFDLLQRRPA